MTQVRRRILWREIKVYVAIYELASTGTRVKVHSLTPPPKTRTFRAAGGKKRFTRVAHKQTTRKVIIMAKSSRKSTKKQSDEIVDNEVDDLEAELDGLDDDEELEVDEVEDEDVEDDEDEDEDDDDEEDEDLSSLSVAELRKRAKANGASTADAKGMNKAALIEFLEADDEDEDEEEEEAPAPKKGKGKNKDAAKPSRSRTTDGKVGSAEIAAAAGVDARTLRMVLRKHQIEKDEETGRYEWDSLKDPEVKKILKLIKSGEADAVKKESLDKLKARKTEVAKDKVKGGKKGKKGKKNKPAADDE